MRRKKMFLSWKWLPNAKLWICRAQGAICHYAKRWIFCINLSMAWIWSITLVPELALCTLTSEWRSTPTFLSSSSVFQDYYAPTACAPRSHSRRDDCKNVSHISKSAINFSKIPRTDGTRMQSKREREMKMWCMCSLATSCAKSTHRRNG